jgi:hypothetical protein
VGGESLLARAVLIVGELGGVPAHICGLKGQSLESWYLFFCCCLTDLFPRFIS